MAIAPADTADPLPGDDGERLARLASTGDRQAFARLVEANYDFVFRVAWRWCGRREDGEDVAQEVCIRLARAIGTWRGEAAFRSWLYALTLNAARDFQRAKIRRTRLVSALMAEPAGQDSTGGPVADDPAEALWAAVRLLPQKQRDAVLLVHGEGLSHGDAASVLQCSESTVSWHVHEARKRLKQMMKAGGSHD